MKRVILLNKRVILSILLVAGISIPVMVQLPVTLMPHKNFVPVKGGKEGKNYAVIIKTDFEKKELVAKTVTFLAGYNLVDSVKEDEITDEQSEYIVPIELRQSFAGIPYVVGAIVSFPSVRIEGDLRFEFHANGNVMIVWENFSETVFCMLMNLLQLLAWHKAQHNLWQQQKEMLNWVVI